MNKRTATLMLFLATLSGIAGAADKDSADRWLYVTTATDNARVLVDTDSVKWPTFEGSNPHDLVVFWVKYASPNGAVLMRRIEIDRANRMICALASTNYDANGGLLSSTTQPTKWEPVIPDSVGDALLQLFDAVDKAWHATQTPTVPPARRY